MRKALLVLGVCMMFLLVACGQQKGTSQTGSDVAAMGDKVVINYVGKFPNGTVFDTNMRSVARQNDINKSAFQPLTVKLGAGEIISGLEQAIVGMKVGQKKTVNLSPAEAYGRKSPQKIMSVNRKEEADRILELDRDVSVPRQRLNRLPGNSTVGEIVEVGEISYEVVSRNESGAELRIAAEEGDTIQLPQTPWNSTVIDVNETAYTVRQDPPNGSIMKTTFGPVRIITGEETLTRRLIVQKGDAVRNQKMGVGRVVNVTEDQATFDFNHPLAGQRIIFEIELIGIQ